MKEYLDRMSRTVEMTRPCFERVLRSVEVMKPLHEKMNLGFASDVAFSNNIGFKNMKWVGNAIDISDLKIQGVGKSLEIIPSMCEKMTLNLETVFEPYQSVLDALESSMELLKTNIGVCVTDDVTNYDDHSHLDDIPTDETLITVESINSYTANQEEESASILLEIYNNLTRDNPDAELLRNRLYCFANSVLYNALFIVCNFVPNDVDALEVVVGLLRLRVGTNELFDFLKHLKIL